GDVVTGFHEVAHRREAGGLSRAQAGTGQDERELPGSDDRAEPLRLLSAVVGERNVGPARVLARHRPLGDAVAHEHDLCGSTGRHDLTVWPTGDPSRPPSGTRLAVVRRALVGLEADGLAELDHVLTEYRRIGA